MPWARLTRRMLPVTFVYFCYGWTLWLYLAWIPSFFLHSYKLNLRDSALFSAGVFFGGVRRRHARRHRQRSDLREDAGVANKARRNLVVFGFLASLAFMVPILFVHNVTVAALCLSTAFFFSEFTIGPMWAIPMDIAPKFSGSASGLMNTGSALAAIVSPLIAGYVIDKTGNWELPFIGSIGLLLDRIDPGVLDEAERGPGRSDLDGRPAGDGDCRLAGAWEPSWRTTIPLAAQLPRKACRFVRGGVRARDRAEAGRARRGALRSRAAARCTRPTARTTGRCRSASSFRATQTM